MISKDDLDVGGRFRQAVGRTADRIDGGADPYAAAAYGGAGKAPAFNYATRVAAVIGSDPRIVEVRNQGLQEIVNGMPSLNLGAVAQQWLSSADTGWVHCFAANAPDPRPYRVYVCTALAHTHTVLRQLLQGYAGALYFKVAAYPEALRRNDTIVSWHATLAEANLWGSIAQASAQLLEGEAPAGTFGPFVRAIGIDSNVTGDTSTHRLARAAADELEKREFHRLPTPFF